MQYSDSFQFALDFIRYTNTSIFLTGRAGTGKTTFLKYCRENTIKNTVVVAPTGVAAMNAGGTTIHSFFQLPFTPYLPSSNPAQGGDRVTDKNDLLSRLRLTNDRREVMLQLDLLIIDEISMVRCDVLDAMDLVLRHVRSQYSKPFGGVQFLLIGDMYQLPPVINDEEWQLLSPWYKSPYFFSSQVIQRHPPVYVELDKIYRQKDESFVSILNQVRNNEMDPEGFSQLHSRYLPDFIPAKDENYITLTTHNSKADAINLNELSILDGGLEVLDASVEGEFFEKSYPADLRLKLKVGAQVMFVKNDTERIRRYFNGKIGRVEMIKEEEILVCCDGIPGSIAVKKEKWRNIRYAVDKTTGQVEESEIGSFTQFPLRLAWAITIHKSQGLTFERAIIDAGEAFAPGQVYVALSRCTMLAGLVLHSRISNNSLYTDMRIAAFTKSQENAIANPDILTHARHKFQMEEISRLFEFSSLQLSAGALLTFLQSHQAALKEDALPWIEQIHALTATIQHTAKKFEPQLNHLLGQRELPEDNEVLQKRIIAAVLHFSMQLQTLRCEIDRCSAEIENKLVAGNFNKLLAAFYTDVCLRLHLLNGCQAGFFADNFLKVKKEFVKPLIPVNAWSGKVHHTKTVSPHPELYNLLRKKRDALSEEKNTPVYLIAGGGTLEEMARFLPQNAETLLRISGFGAVKVRQYGDAFLSIIREYCEQYDLQTNIESKPIKAARGKVPRKKRAV